jgi:hypothetical protein
MRKYLKWVVGLIGVSSKKETKLFSAVFVVALLFAVAAIFGSAKTLIASDITIENVVNLTNQSRGESGEQVLSVNSKLSAAAEAKAEDMISKNYFSHTSPAGVTPWRWIEKENYEYNYAGENLAMDFHSAEKMEEAWMASPTHRANIMNEKYSDIGVAVKEGLINGHDTILAVVMFGSGDKNISSSSSDRNDVLSTVQHGNGEMIIPVLSEGEKKNNSVIARSPFITSPQSGSELSSDDLEVRGQSNPGESVTIFDNGNKTVSTVADSDGWFFAVLENIPEGEHLLATGNEKQIFERQTKVIVDREKPEINFYVYADDLNSNQFVLEANTDKKDCIFQFNGETKKTDAWGKALFSIGSAKSSAILRVRDSAGNKNFSQVTLANYYSPEYKNSISETLASVFSSGKNIFAIDSGREAMQKKLNIVSHQFLALRAENKN